VETVREVMVPSHGLSWMETLGFYRQTSENCFHKRENTFNDAVTYTKMNES